MKQGDTFSFIVRVVDKTTKEPLVGVANRLKCQAKYFGSNDVLVEMAITELGQGEYLFVAPSTNWKPNSQINFDIRYTDQNAVLTSQTFSVQVEVAITSG